MLDKSTSGASDCNGAAPLKEGEAGSEEKDDEDGREKEEEVERDGPAEEA